MTIVQVVNWHLGKTRMLIFVPTNSKYSSRFCILLKDFLVDNFRYFPNVRSTDPIPPNVRLMIVMQKSICESSLTKLDIYLVLIFRPRLEHIKSFQGGYTQT